MAWRLVGALLCTKPVYLIQPLKLCNVCTLLRVISLGYKSSVLLLVGLHEIGNQCHLHLDGSRNIDW